MKMISEDIITSIKNFGYQHRYFELKLIGNYLPQDSEWNYKDVPHLDFVHKNVKAINIFIERDIVTAIMHQKLLFINIPLVLVNYQSKNSNELIYYTTFLFFTMLVVTNFNLIDNKTLTTTRYNIFGSKFLLFIFFRFIKYILTKNFNVLMSEDNVMRERRQFNRQNNAVYKNESHDFLNSVNVTKNNIMFNNVIFDPNRDERIERIENVNNIKTIFTGISNIYGCKISLNSQKVYISQRICEHEGACLDEAEVINGYVKCLWHGRVTKIIHTCNIEGLTEIKFKYRSMDYSFNINNLVLKIQ
jgi:hypothetical protein